MADYRTSSTRKSYKSAIALAVAKGHCWLVIKRVFKRINTITSVVIPKAVHTLISFREDYQCQHTADIVPSKSVHAIFTEKDIIDLIKKMGIGLDRQHVGG
jgi:uncharacterized protein YcaQ